MDAVRRKNLETSNNKVITVFGHDSTSESAWLVIFSFYSWGIYRSSHSFMLLLVLSYERT